MTIPDESDVVTIDFDDDAPSSKRSKTDEIEPRRSSRRGNYKEDDDWTPTNKSAKKSSGLKEHSEDATSQKKRLRSPSPIASNDYQKSSRRPNSLKENGMNYRTSNDTFAQMLGVLMARVEKMETDRKKKIELEQKVEDLETTINTMKEEMDSLKKKAEEGVRSGEKIDQVKEDVGRMTGRVDSLEVAKDTTANRLEGVKQMLKQTVINRIQNLEKNRQNDVEKLESHFQKMDTLEKSLHDIEKEKMIVASNPTPVKAPLPHMATPEQLRQLPKLPVMPINLPSTMSSFSSSNVNNEEELISPGHITDLITDLDDELKGMNGDSSMKIQLPLTSDLPLYSQEENKSGLDKQIEKSIPSLPDTSETAPKKTEESSANITKPVPVKISLLSLKKKPIKEAQDKQGDTTDEKNNNEESRGVNDKSPSTTTEQALNSLPLYDADSIKDSNDNDPSAPKKANKFFKSKQQ